MIVPTPEQAAIVSSAEGPLRIDAGAGTGKTWTLVRLIEHLVDTGTEPERVLGVTFTNKAAGELAGRVRAALADRVEPGVEADVHTYHGFAARLLREFGPFVGVERDVRVITPTFSRQLLLEALATTPGVDLDLTNPSLRIDHLLRLASASADHLVDPADLLVAQPVDEVEAQRSELARVLVAYTSEKRRLGVVDYGDLIALAHRLATDHPEARRRIAGRYDAVLLDEYQDTDPAQRLLMQALFADGRTVVAVGDADQTIYEWRGASLENFAAFPVHFPTAGGARAPTLPLTVNRRSGQAILDVANAVRARISDDHRPPLVAPDGAPAARVTAGWYRTAVDEAAAIADRVVEHAAEGTAYRDMAVLARANNDIAVIREALADAGVPVEVASLGGLLDVPEVVEVHAWLRLLADPADSVAFGRIVMGSRGRLGPADLKPLSDWVRDGDDAGPTRSFAESLDHLAALDLRPEAAEVLASVGRSLRHLLALAQGLSLVELVREILTETNAWRDVEALPPAASLSARLNLYRLLDLAEDWSPLEGRPSLDAFLAHLGLLRENPTEELDTARISGEDAVTLLSIHRAKGLEWDVVFLPTLADLKFPTRVRVHEDPWRQPWVLPPDHRLDRDTFPHLDPEDVAARRAVLTERHRRAEWRLAYVAITRARRVLHASGAAWYGIPTPTVNPKQPSELFTEIVDVDGVDVVADEPPGPRPETLRPPATTGDAPDPLFDGGWAAAVRAAAADPGLPDRLAREAGVTEAYDAIVEAHQAMLFSLPEAPPHAVATPTPTVSVSGAVTYARCPQQFFWSHVEPLPRRPNPAAARGVAVHRRIELHNLGHLPLDDADAAVYDVVDTPGAGAGAHATFLGSRFAEERPRLVEAPFEVPVGDVLVRGRIDAIYGDDTHWEIVDFKSGRPSDDPAVGLQLDAYAVAVDAGVVSPSAPDRLSVTFAYLGDGLVEHTAKVTPEWLAAARARLEATVAGIGEEAWDPTPGDHCARCDFLAVCTAGRTHLEGAGA